MLHGMYKISSRMSSQKIQNHNKNNNKNTKTDQWLNDLGTTNSNNNTNGILNLNTLNQNLNQINLI